MSNITYEKLYKSLERLKEQYENFLTLDKKNISELDKENISELDKEAIKESTIRRFEICYDSFFKGLKKYLQEEGVAVDSSSPKAILRQAHKSGLIDQETLEDWFAHIELRIRIAHDYSLEKVEWALSKMSDFIEDVNSIYKIMCPS